jgi:methionine-rich copper-binding protein CopC
MRFSQMVRAVLLAMAVLCWAAAPALAAPTVLSTDPEEGAQLHKAPDRVTIEFSEPLSDPSDIEVEDGCGRRVDDGEATIGGTLSNELSVGLGPTPYHGTYTVTYVATGVTGTASDDYTFDVHAGKACGGGGGGGGGGGHGGHGGGGGHNGHGGGSGGGGHDGHDGGGDHDGGGGEDHGSMSGHDDDQMDGDHSMSGDHNEHGGKNGKHAQHRPNRDRTDTAEDNPPRAAVDILPATDIPTGTTVVVGLGLALLMGALGGWVLRVSSPS